MTKPSKLISYFYTRTKNIGPVTDTLPDNSFKEPTTTKLEGNMEKALQIQQEQWELLVRKNAMYASSNIALGQSDMTNPSNIQDSLISIAVRMRDKVNRLNQIVKQLDERELDSQLSDSLADTLNDIANYAVIGRIVQKGQWEVNED